MTSCYPIGTIINFCSNDYPFLRHCINAVKPFSSQIVIPVCDHFFDGKKEERKTLSAIYAENPDVQFVEFPFDPDRTLYGARPNVYWHNLARMLARFFLKGEISYVLFLDSDEIAEKARLLQWFQQFPYQDFEAFLFLNYWYFRAATLQAATWESSPLLVKKQLLDRTLLMHEKERLGIYLHMQGAKVDGQGGLDGKPFFHHYSWVRTQEQLLRKVASWGHNLDTNWESKVQEEFSRPFSGTDFVHGYTYKKVSPYVPVDLDKTPPATRLATFSHVRTLSQEEVSRIDLSLTYQIPLCL